MPLIAGYRRPGTVQEALGLLEEPGSVALAGGTWLNGKATPNPVLVVDLQALELSGIESVAGGGLRVGAMATLQQLVDDGRVPRAMRDAARRAEPSTLRAAATIGGCVAIAEPSSELLATLLVHDAIVELAHDRTEHLPLAALLADLSRLEGRIITAVTIETTGVTSAARVGRTRADRPIVAAVARRTPDGERRLALTGVAATPVLVTGVDELSPPGDFLGSSEYRKAVAAILAARALEAVG
jgi:CO/xanthine dehydrogenase FAD-binding subunit